MTSEELRGPHGVLVLEPQHESDGVERGIGKAPRGPGEGRSETRKSRTETWSREGTGLSLLTCFAVISVAGSGFELWTPRPWSQLGAPSCGHSCVGDAVRRESHPPRASATPGRPEVTTPQKASCERGTLPSSHPLLASGLPGASSQAVAGATLVRSGVGGLEGQPVLQQVGGYSGLGPCGWGWAPRPGAPCSSSCPCGRTRNAFGLGFVPSLCGL